MAWQDRSYNRGGDGGAEYLGNPALFLNLSVPFGTWFGVTVRLHFWLLLTIFLAYMGGNIIVRPIDTTCACALVIATLLVHEFSHRRCAHWVGGSYEEFLIWPSGGLGAPHAPMEPLATFIANAGGIAANLVFAALSFGGLVLCHDAIAVPMNFLSILWPFGVLVPETRLAGAPLIFTLQVLFHANIGLVLINLLPFYVFDGGHLWEAALWRWLGRFRAVGVTCIAGMVVAVPYFLFCLFVRDLLGIIFFALLFASAFSKRRELAASSGGELENAIAMSAQDTDAHGSPRRSKPGRWPSRSAAKRAAKSAAEQRKEQDQIDAILAKVHAKGMNSLNWLERRALKKATERQRRRSGAP